MDRQTDDPNVQNIPAGAGGVELEAFFGCWLDINQPFNNVLPISVDPFFPMGHLVSHLGFRRCRSSRPSCATCISAWSRKSLSIRSPYLPARTRGTGTSWRSATWRGAIWARAGAGHIRGPRHSGSTHPEDRADELMIDWGNAPNGEGGFDLHAQASADQLLDMPCARTPRIGCCARTSTRCAAGGRHHVHSGAPRRQHRLHSTAVTDPPQHSRHGQTSGSGAAGDQRLRHLEAAARHAGGRRKRTDESAEKVGRADRGVAAQGGSRCWGRSSSPFRCTPKTICCLKRGEHVFRDAMDRGGIPAENRWHSVFTRYLEQIAGRVRVFGGDPGILPSPTGDPAKPPKDGR